MKSETVVPRYRTPADFRRTPYRGAQHTLVDTGKVDRYVERGRCWRPGAVSLGEMLLKSFSGTIFSECYPMIG
jgi:hypothetical protein